MAAVVSNGVEHLEGGVASLDELGHGARGEARTLGILEGVVGVDTDILGLAQVVGQGDTLGGTEVFVVVAVVVGVGVSTGILDQLDQVAGLLVVGRGADGGVFVESLLEAQLVVGNSFGLQVGVADAGDLVHEEVAVVVGRPTAGRTAGNNVVAGLELGLLAHGEGEGDTRHGDNLGGIALESFGARGAAATSLRIVGSRLTSDTADTARAGDLDTLGIVPLARGVAVTENLGSFLGTILVDVGNPIVTGIIEVIVTTADQGAVGADVSHGVGLIEQVGVFHDVLVAVEVVNTHTDVEDKILEVELVLDVASGINRGE